MKMPIIRKVVSVGDSRGITIPKSWLEYFEKESGKEICEVAIEVDRVLTISPIFSKKKAPAT
jgi:antitoxin component of MazEF toxin-antitoxin module